MNTVFMGINRRKWRSNEVTVPEWEKGLPGVPVMRAAKELEPADSLTGAQCNAYAEERASSSFWKGVGAGVLGTFALSFIYTWWVTR